MPEHDATEAADLVSSYLQLVEARDLERAADFLAPDATITFPGGRVFANLTDQVASSSGRFQWVQKTFDRIDTSIDGDSVVVYAFGVLDGVAVDGTPFESVRFIDRFVLRAGQIVDHMVWNDLGERGVVGTD